MLPDFVWDKLLPEDFGVTLDDAMIQRMKQISQNYSKARNKPDAAFSHDGETKRQGATPEIIAAAKTFASEIYGQLEALLGQGNN